MVILLFHFFLVSSAAAVGLSPPSTYRAGCELTSCKRGGPFRLKGRQPDHCGYSGFNLTCNNDNHTVLELPRSVKLLVKRIDYKNQRIQVYAEDGCVQNQLQNLRLSLSPFSLSLNSDYYATPQNMTLFECADGAQSNVNDYRGIRCLSTKPGFHVKYTDSRYASTDLLHCRKTIDLIQVPEGLISHRSNNFYFNWSRPECDVCEVRRQGCRRNDSNASAFECFPIPIKHMALTMGGFFLVMILGLLLWMRKKEKDAQRKIKQFLEDYKALKPLLENSVISGLIIVISLLANNLLWLWDI